MTKQTSGPHLGWLFSPIFQIRRPTHFPWKIFFWKWPIFTVRSWTPSPTLFLCLSVVVPPAVASWGGKVRDRGMSVPSAVIRRDLGTWLEEEAASASRYTEPGLGQGHVRILASSGLPGPHEHHVGGEKSLSWAHDLTDRALWTPGERYPEHFLLESTREGHELSYNLYWSTRVTWHYNLMQSCHSYIPSTHSDVGFFRII